MTAAATASACIKCPVVLTWVMCLSLTFRMSHVSLLYTPTQTRIHTQTDTQTQTQTQTYTHSQQSRLWCLSWRTRRDYLLRPFRVYLMDYETLPIREIAYRKMTKIAWEHESCLSLIHEVMSLSYTRTLSLLTHWKMTKIAWEHESCLSLIHESCLSLIQSSLTERGQRLLGLLCSHSLSLWSLNLP